MTLTSGSDLLRRCGVSEVTTPMWTLAEDAAGYAQAGFAAIGVWLHKLEQPRMDTGFFMPQKDIPQSLVDAAVGAVTGAGLRVSHVILAGGYTDDDTRQRAVEYSLHAIDIAAALNADCLIINPGRLNGLDRKAAMDVSARTLSEIVEARRSPVRLALEPVIDWQSDFLNTLGQALDLADLVDHPDVGVYPDTYHLWQTDTYYDDITRAGARIFGFHLNDGANGERARRIPGDGQIPLVDMVRAAQAAGYSGTYDVEFVYPVDLINTDPDAYAPEAVLRRCAAGMTQILAEAGVS